MPPEEQAPIPEPAQTPQETPLDAPASLEEAAGVPEAGSEGEAAPEPVAPNPLDAKLQDALDAIEQKSIEMDRLSARLEHTRLQRDKIAGRAGHERRQAPPPQAEADPDDQIARLRAEIDDLRAGHDSIRIDAVDRAIREETTAFRAQLGDLPEQDLAKHVQRLRAEPDYAEAMDSGDAKLARSATRALLKEALASAKLDRLAAQRATRSASSTNLTRAKQSAASGGSGPGGGAPPQKKELSQDQISAALDKMFARR